MRIYLEPVNLRQWNLFDNVKGSGHVECFLATRDMQLGDIVILHVGKQDPAHESGVYAYGTVIYGPYILENCPAEYCNNKLTVDVRIDHIVYDTPTSNVRDTLASIEMFTPSQILSMTI